MHSNKILYLRRITNSDIAREIITAYIHTYSPEFNNLRRKFDEIFQDISDGYDGVRTYPHKIPSFKSINTLDQAEEIIRLLKFNYSFNYSHVAISTHIAGRSFTIELIYHGGIVLTRIIAYRCEPDNCFRVWGK